MAQIVFVTAGSTSAQAASVSTTSCGTYETGVDLGDIKVSPLHGKAFYTDLKNGINATYVGYKIDNETGASLDNIWVQIDDFRAVTGTSVLGLVNPADNAMPVTPSDTANNPPGRITSGGSAFVYFLVKASDVTANAQRHDIHIFRGDPNGSGSEYGTGYNCYYELNSVKRTLAASANKVTQVTADSTAKLGGTVTVTVKGATGQAGSGDTSASGDGDAMWLSPASSSSWPTRALRLESVSIVIKYKKNDPVNQWATVNNSLLLKNIACSASGGSCKSFTSATTYTATYTFRVVGKSDTNAAVMPVAQIASGTQMKHTGTYPTTITMVPTSDPGKVIKVEKTIDSAYTITHSGGYFYIRYQAKLTNTDSTAVAVDEVLDVPASNVSLSPGTVKVKDKYRLTETALSPEPSSKDDQGRYHFGGPFTIAANGTAYVYYVMKIPDPATFPGNTSNIAYGVVGPTLIGADLSTALVTDCVVTLNSNGTTTNSCDPVTPPKQAQTITFPQPPSQGSGTSYVLDATSSSGLDVSYRIVSGPCTISGNSVIYQAQGSCIIEASQSGDSIYSAATPVQRTVTILPQQIITFPQPNSMTTSTTQDVTITSSSGLKVTLTSLDITICKVGSTSSTPADTFTPATGGSDVFRVTSYSTAGNCPLVASQAGDGVTYGAALSVDRTIPVGLSTQVLTTIGSGPPATQSSSTGSVNWAVSSRALTSTGTLLDLPITFTSQTPSICTAGDAARQTSGGSTYASYQASINWTQPGVCVVQASQDGLTATGTQSAYGAADPITISFSIGATPVVTISTVTAVKSAANFNVTVVVEKPAGATGAPKGTLTLYTSGDHTSQPVQSGSPLVTNVSGISNKYVFSVDASELPATGSSGSISLFATYTSVGPVSGETTYNNSQTVSPASVTVYSPAAILISPSKSTVFVNEAYTATVTVIGNSAYGYPAGTITLTTIDGGTISTSMPATLNSSGAVTANLTAGSDPSKSMVLNASYTPSGGSTTYFNSQSSSVTALSNRTVEIDPRTYTVTYNSNGGSGTMVNQISNTAVALSTNTITRDGYSFAGWNTASNGLGTPYSDSQTYDFLANLDLYAQWTALPTYTVHFDANGGTGSMSDQTNYASAALTTNSFSYHGKSFVGWNTAANGSGDPYSDGTSYSFNANMTLYAQWTDLPTHTVTFDANGGAGTMSVQTNFEAAALTANSFNRAGYSFSGWATNRDGTGTTYANGGSYPFTADVTLYAKWTLLPRYTVHFDANGGSGSMSDQTNYQRAPLMSNTFGRQGYSFSGWTTGQDGSGTAYTNGAQYAFTQDVTLFAQWTALPMHSVTFDANSGTGSMAQQTGNYSKPLNAIDFTREAYSFVEWNTEPDGSGDSYANGGMYAFTSDTTLYAQWDALPTYTVTYFPNGGSGTMSPQTAYSPQPLLSNGYNYSGYTFLGWNTAANGSGDAYVEGGTFAFTGDLNLYAQWERTRHTITFHANHGMGSMDPQTNNATTQIDAVRFFRIGYGFTGWNTHADGSGTSYDNGANYDFYSNLELYAQWDPDDYVVTYDPRSGTLSPLSESYSVGDNPLTLPLPALNGYTFAGWSEDPAGVFGDVGIDGDEYTPTASTTLYAQWTPNRYNVNYFAQGGSVFPLSEEFIFDGNPLALPQPSRPGHHFDGWSLDSLGVSGILGVEGDDFTPSVSPTNLYAQWTADIYSVNYDPQDGTVDRSSDDFTYGGRLIILPTPTLEDYAFDGWNTEPDGSGQTVGYGDDDFEPASSLTLYAQWHLVVWTVTYSANGGTGTMLDQVDHVPSQLSTSTFERTGYSFGGWNTAIDGSGDPYLDSEEWPFEADLALFAQWIPNEYTVTYHGRGADADPDSDIFTVGNDPLELPAVSRNGYEFNGWTSESNGGGEFVGMSNDPYTPNRTVELYAQWTPEVYRIDYDAQGGSSSTAWDDFTFDGDPLALPTPSRTGYTFVEWNTVEDGTGETAGGAGDSYSPTQSMTLYAQWDPDIYHVQYDPQGGYVDYLDEWYTVGTDALTLPATTRDGWAFVGWNTELDGSGTRVGRTSDPFTPTDALILYAEWHPLEFTVRFNANLGEGSMSDQVSTSRTALTANTFTRAGYDFDGWNTASDGTGNPFSNGIEFEFDDDLILYAQWTPHVYVVTFEPEGGFLDELTVDYTYGADPLTLPAPSRDGFQFMGWSVLPGDRVSTVGVNGDAFEPDGDVTLYAVWVPITQTQSLGGFVWVDLDGDGIQDSDEPYLPGLDMQLEELAPSTITPAQSMASSLSQPAAFVGTVERSIIAMLIVTGSDGSYFLGVIPVGDWVLRALLPTKLSPTGESDSDPNGDISLTVSPGAALNTWMGVRGHSGIEAPIFGSDGKPTSDDILLLWDGIDEQLITEDDVTFSTDPTTGIVRISGLPSGSYRLISVGALDADSECVDIVLREFQTFNEDIITQEGYNCHPSTLAETGAGASVISALWWGVGSITIAILLLARTVTRRRLSA
ncbi:MAG: InlB B-repeat-containing protein [Microbacteriaceae bacterium]